MPFITDWRTLRPLIPKMFLVPIEPEVHPRTKMCSIKVDQGQVPFPSITSPENDFKSMPPAKDFVDL